MENYVKPPIGSLARLRAVHILSLVVFAVVLGLAASAWAQSTKSGVSGVAGALAASVTSKYAS